jgi:hypothetical protein
MDFRFLQAPSALPGDSRNASASVAIPSRPMTAMKRSSNRRPRNPRRGACRVPTPISDTYIESGRNTRGSRLCGGRDVMRKRGRIPAVLGGERIDQGRSTKADIVDTGNCLDFHRSPAQECSVETFELDV